MTNAQRLYAGFSIGGVPPRSMPAVPVATVPVATSSTAGPSRAAASRQTWSNLPTSNVDRTATRHDMPSGPGWVEPEGSQQDGLDILIVGVKNGSIPTDDVSAPLEFSDEKVSDHGSDDDADDEVRPASSAELTTAWESSQVGRLLQVRPETRGRLEERT